MLKQGPATEYDTLDPELQELEAQLKQRPDWARIAELKQLQREHPDKIMVRIEIQEVEHRRMKLMQPTLVWAIFFRSTKELLTWDRWVRHELKRKLDLDEPPSYTEDDLNLAKVREQANK